MSKQIEQVVRKIMDTPLGVHFLGSPGDQVIFIPEHRFGEHQKVEAWGYPNGIQPGFIMSMASGDDYFVRYWNWDSSVGVFIPDLRTKTNSERTSARNLFFFEFFEQKLVYKAIKEIEQEDEKGPPF
jgi:hypothetical protein